VHQGLFAVDPKFAQLTQTDPARQKLGSRMEEAAVNAKLKEYSGAFITQFSRAPGQSQDGFDASVHQALFLSNGQPVLSWIDGLAGRLAAIAEPGQLIDELYLCLLTRHPADDERDEDLRYLASQPTTKARAISELAWALLTSTEFRFNH
jgi:hypothetical protein